MSNEMTIDAKETQRVVEGMVMTEPDDGDWDDLKPDEDCQEIDPRDPIQNAW